MVSGVLNAVTEMVVAYTVYQVLVDVTLQVIIFHALLFFFSHNLYHTLRLVSLSCFIILSVSCPEEMFGSVYIRVFHMYLSVSIYLSIHLFVYLAIYLSRPFIYMYECSYIYTVNQQGEEIRTPEKIQIRVGSD